MRNRCDIPNQSNLYACRLNRSHSRFSAGPRTLYPDLARIHPQFSGCLSSADTSLLRCKWSALP
jgi:hypothetical protein